MKKISAFWMIAVLALWGIFDSAFGAEEGGFRAGAATVETTPEQLPVKCNGGFVPRMVDRISDPLSACALALSDGVAEMVFCTVDACGMNDQLRNDVAAEVEQKSGIPADHILIAATHCHSAPALTLILGCDADENYVSFVRPKIVEAILRAHDHLQPAKIGFGVAEDRENVYVRRFLMRPDTAATHPTAFTGAARNLAMMNPGMNNPNAITRTGVPDPEVSVLAIQTPEGKPLALLANYSLHYVGADGISSDYYGIFRKKIGEKLGADENFTALLTNGTSGDVNAIDFLDPERKFDKETVAESVAEAAKRACGSMTFHDQVPLDLRSELMTLAIRKPSAEDVAEAKAYLEKEGITAPRSDRDLYAFDTVALSDDPGTRTLRLQTFRIGPIAVSAIPCEVYSFTGLDLKANTPAERTFTISLANGYFGYIPTVWSFELGGYNTWRARSCCLEVEAEPKIRAKILGLQREMF